jgi:hypothetical protein
MHSHTLRALRVHVCDRDGVRLCPQVLHDPSISDKHLQRKVGGLQKCSWWSSFIIFIILSTCLLSSTLSLPPRIIPPSSIPLGVKWSSKRRRA